MQSFAPICCLIHTYLLTVYSPSRHRPPPSETALSYACQKFSPKDLASDPFFILDSDHGTRCYSQSFKRALKIDFLGNASYSSSILPKVLCTHPPPLSPPSRSGFWVLPRQISPFVLSSRNPVDRIFSLWKARMLWLVLISCLEKCLNVIAAKTWFLIQLYQA